MDYDIELQHKPGKTMIPADVLSRRHDHSIGIEEVEDIIGLPEKLFIKLLDLDLRDAVVSGQRKDETAQEALTKLSDPEIQLASRGRTQWFPLSLLRRKTLCPRRSRLATKDCL